VPNPKLKLGENKTLSFGMGSKAYRTYNDKVPSTKLKVQKLKPLSVLGVEQDLTDVPCDDLGLRM
jgi:hypothetical protein